MLGGLIDEGFGVLAFVGVRYFIQVFGFNDMLVDDVSERSLRHDCDMVMFASFMEKFNVVMQC